MMVDRHSREWGARYGMRRTRVLAAEPDEFGRQPPLGLCLAEGNPLELATTTCLNLWWAATRSGCIAAVPIGK